MPEEYGATVVSNYTETPSVYVVQMKLSRPMQFMAGQWIYVYTTNNGKEVKKPYSIASPPSFMKESMLELCVKRVENGFMSTFIAGMKEGTQLKLTGPYGVFSLKENSNEKIFIATGSGIAPFHSMIPELFDKGFAGDVWLFFGVRKQEDIIYRKFFDELAAKHLNFHFVPILSREDWQGEKGHVQDVLPRYLKSSEGKDVYICGLLPMIEEIEPMLKHLGFSQEHLHFEKYI